MTDEAVAHDPAVPVQVRDNPAQQRYEATVDGLPAGFAAYRIRPGLIAFVHTEIDDGFAGQGVGSALIREALDEARRRGLDVLPVCPFVNAFIERHLEYRDLVPAAQREAFGL
jgi:predicted GNAT family acetyltransferase